MKKYLFYLCGDRNKASSRVRGYWIAEELAANGVKCSIEYRHSYIALFEFLLRIPFYDVVIFQKSYSRWHCQLLRVAKLLNKKTILDLDDAPSRTNNTVTLRNVEFMMRNVSAVTVGSKFLLNYASQFSSCVKLVPSSIYLKYYQPAEKMESESEPVCLGWIGNGKHYKKDLISILKEPLTKIAKRKPIGFKLIGACGERELYDAFANIDGLELDFIDQIEWSDPAVVSEALCGIDIGLYPLLTNDSNRYKCGFKALEYMAMKIPVISSRVAENSMIIEENTNGLFADSVEEWTDTLEKLINNNQLRVSMGKDGRDLVEEQYSVTGVVDSFLGLFDVNAKGAI